MSLLQEMRHCQVEGDVDARKKVLSILSPHLPRKEYAQMTPETFENLGYLNLMEEEQQHLQMASAKATKAALDFLKNCYQWLC